MLCVVLVSLSWCCDIIGVFSHLVFCFVGLSELGYVALRLRLLLCFGAALGSRFGLEKHQSKACLLPSLALQFRRLMGSAFFME